MAAGPGDALSALRRQRRDDQEFKASLSCIVAWDADKDHCSSSHTTILNVDLEEPKMFKLGASLPGHYQRTFAKVGE